MAMGKLIIKCGVIAMALLTLTMYAQEDFGEIDDYLAQLTEKGEKEEQQLFEEKAIEEESEKVDITDDIDDHEGHSHGSKGHTPGSGDQNFDVFYTTFASLDLNQFVGKSLRRTFDVKNLEAGIGFIIGDQLETFFMVYKEEGPGFNIGLHEAEISYYPTKKIEITGGLFHMPFGWGSKKLLFEPLINDCKIMVHEEITVIDTIIQGDTTFKKDDIIEEVPFHSITTHAPGLSGSYNFGKLKLGGSYYIQPDEGLGDHTGHSHGGFGAHQGVTLRADYKINSWIKTGLGTRLRVADVEHHEHEEELRQYNLTQKKEEKDESKTKADLDFDAGLKVKPLQNLTLLTELYFSSSANIAPDQGKFFGYLLEADYFLRENWLVSTRFDHYINSDIIDEHHEEHTSVRNRYEEVEEEKHNTHSLVQFGLGSTYNISEYFAIKGEFNIRNPVEIFHDSSKASEIKIGLQMSFSFSK